MDVERFLFDASTRLRSRWSRNLLRRLNGSIGFVSSRLFALKAGTVFRDKQGEWKAAPLFKPLANGSAVPIQSGFQITGLLDVFGQLAVALALGKLGRSFVLMDDQVPGELEQFNLICFGSPTSNGVSGQVFERLASVLGSEIEWTENFDAFQFDSKEFKSGTDGLVIAYDSPWNSARSVLVMAGIGPAGTFAGSQLLSRWSATLPARRQRRSGRFVAAVTSVSNTDVPRVTAFRELQ